MIFIWINKVNLLIRNLKSSYEIPINAKRFKFLELVFVTSRKIQCPVCNNIIDAIQLNQKICCDQCGHWIAWHHSDIWTLHVWRDNVYERKPNFIQRIVNFFKGL